MWSASGDDPRDASGRGGEGPVVIGFINNMPDAALQKTERRFRDLLSLTPYGNRVCLKPFFLPEVARSDSGQAYLNQYYEDINRLWTTPVDGLIVTGCEPRAPALKDEPYWNSLARLVDWADAHTVSTIWSCLAAHVAVLHTDGVKRRPLGEKLSGVFTSRKVADHPLLAGVPSQWPVPHSRYNGLPEEQLEAAGYLLLSTSPEAGVDLFIKQQTSLFVFMHGHPEYDATALAREYRRDVIRFLSAKRHHYPEIPLNYFDSEVVPALAAFRRRAIERRGLELLTEMPAALSELTPRQTWKEPATRIFTNWLCYLVTEKLQRNRIKACEVETPCTMLDGPADLQVPLPVADIIPHVISAR